MKINFDPKNIASLVQLAIDEDIGNGDITTQGLIPDDLVVRTDFMAKEPGIIAGLPVVEYFFSRLDKNVVFVKSIEEGSTVNRGNTIATITGNARTLLSGERIALNFLQRLSGIATLTAQFVQQIKPFTAQIMDTRKTLPGWRYLEKYAVAVGGGVNHRMGLYDQVLIKDNHLDILKNHVNTKMNSFNSSIENAVFLLRKKIKNTILVEIETRTGEEVIQALASGADIILFDNMSIPQIKEAVSVVNRWKQRKSVMHPLTESSGNITLENVYHIAETGVDRISIGAITHSAKALDISLKISAG